jgi:hypothetical protein
MTDLTSGNLEVKWDYEAQVFIFTIKDQEEIYFQMTLYPESFEKLTSDMVKVLKNYNLYRAEQYLSRKEAEQNEIENSVDNRETKAIGFERSPDQPENPI